MIALFSTRGLSLLAFHSALARLKDTLTPAPRCRFCADRLPLHTPPRYQGACVRCALENFEWLQECGWQRVDVS